MPMPPVCRHDEYDATMEGTGEDATTTYAAGLLAGVDVDVADDQVLAREPGRG